MWRDNETTVDLLGVEHLLAAGESILTNERLLPLTVGIFGGWGSGKSSLARMIYERIEEEDDVLPIWFNGWVFERYDDAKAALIGTILDEIEENRTLGEQAKQLLRRLKDRVDVFRLLGMAGQQVVTLSAGLPPEYAAAAGAVTVAGDVMADADAEEGEGENGHPEDQARQSVREFRKNFSDLLDQTGVRTLVVFIDDLDRCLPDTVLQTLEAIRLFLFVDQTAFVISADEELVEDAVGRRYPERDRESLNIGRHYLEKLIQIPLRIPPLGQAEIETYMNLLFAELHLDADSFERVLADAQEQSPDALGDVRCTLGEVEELLDEVPAALREGLTLSAQTADVLTAGYDGNPRQTKRFLNTLLLRTEMAGAQGIDLQRRIMAKLMLLEHFRTDEFKQLSRLQAAEGGRSEELESLERHVRSPQGAGEEDGEEPEEPEDGDQENGGEGAVAEICEEEAIGETLADWFEDEWLLDWLRADPRLGSVDLRPYFFFARETLEPWKGAAELLSDPAREALRQLLEPAEVTRRRGAEAAVDLAAGELKVIVDELSEQLRREEKQTRDSAPLEGLFALAEADEELTGDLVDALRRLPHARIASGVPPRISGLAQGTAAEEATRELVDSWCQSVVPSLRAAAEQTIGMLD